MQRITLGLSNKAQEYKQIKDNLKEELVEKDNLIVELQNQLKEQKTQNHQLQSEID